MSTMFYHDEAQRIVKHLNRVQSSVTFKAIQDGSIFSKIEGYLIGLKIHLYIDKGYLSIQCYDMWQLPHVSYRDVNHIDSPNRFSHKSITAGKVNKWFNHIREKYNILKPLSDEREANVNNGEAWLKYNGFEKRANGWVLPDSNYHITAQAEIWDDGKLYFTLRLNGSLSGETHEDTLAMLRELNSTIKKYDKYEKNKK